MTTQPPGPPSLSRKLTSVATCVCVAMFAVAPALAFPSDFSEQARLSVLHVAVVFGVLMCVFRVIGKRELSRLSPFEFVTLMLVPELVSEVVQGKGELSASLVGLSTLFFLVLMTSMLSHRFRSFQSLIEPSPTVLVSDGRLLERNMNNERIAPDELLSEMHKQGLEHLHQLKWAVLEPSGHITFVPKTGLPAPSAGDDAEVE